MGFQRYSMRTYQSGVRMEKDTEGDWVDADEAADESKRNIDRINVLKQALALHHSIVLSGESVSDESETTYRTAMDI
jgi:hypothetical protein